MYTIPFAHINWDDIEKTVHTGTTGTAYWKTVHADGLRIRMVEYSENYEADHWCSKGHIVHCLEGEFVSELNDGTKYTLSKGMTYIVSDDLSSHKSISASGVKLLIIDGGFLEPKVV